GSDFARSSRCWRTCRSLHTRRIGGRRSSDRADAWVRTGRQGVRRSTLRARACERVTCLTNPVRRAWLQYGLNFPSPGDWLKAYLRAAGLEALLDFSPHSPEEPAPV